MLALLCAVYDGRIPAEWGAYEGNHGPWRHYYPGRNLLSSALLLPLYAGGASLVSVLLEQKRKTLLTLLVCIALYVIEVQSLYWLID